jgi:quercetin dioxygenase-like cupin family protein
MLVVGLFPLAVAPQIVAPKTVFENQSVRVEVLALPPGTGTGRHQGIEAEVGIIVEGEPTLDSPLSHQVLQPGTAYSLPGLIPHDIRNEGDRPLKMFVVLLKRCD